jgi:hypothetical protein
VEDIDSEWVDLVFKPAVFVELVKKQPNQWWPVVVGHARQGEETLVEVEYQQGDWNQCMFKATASSLHYCGLEHVASHFSNAALIVQYLPHETVMQTLRETMINTCLKYCRCCGI